MWKALDALKSMSLIVAPGFYFSPQMLCLKRKKEKSKENQITIRTRNISNIWVKMLMSAIAMKMKCLLKRKLGIRDCIDQLHKVDKLMLVICILRKGLYGNWESGRTSILKCKVGFLKKWPNLWILSGVFQKIKSLIY